MLDDKARKAISKQLDDSVDMLVKESIEIDSARASNNLGFSSDTSTTLIQERKTSVMLSMMA